jgi:hypothetical protein
VLTFYSLWPGRLIMARTFTKRRSRCRFRPLLENLERRVLPRFLAPLAFDATTTTWFPWGN